MSPGKRKMKEAASPPVTLIIYEICGTKMARRRDEKNHITLSTLNRIPSERQEREPFPSVSVE